MNTRKQQPFKKFESKFDRKATIADKLRRREVIDRSAKLLNNAGNEELVEYDEYETTSFEAYIK